MQEESATTKRYVEESRVASEKALMEAEWDPGDSFMMFHEGLIGWLGNVVNTTSHALLKSFANVNVVVCGRQPEPSFLV
jgi:hypothetical protein